MTLCFTTTPSCNHTTDGRTVSTPQRHLPTFPTLTLKKNLEPSLLPGLHLWLRPTTMSTTSSSLVSPDTPSGSPLLQRPLTPCQPPANIPTFITPTAPPSILPVWEHVIAVLMKLPPTTAEGQNLRPTTPLPL